MAVLLYLYGDNPEHFDYIYIAGLCLSCVFCFADKDTFGALLILLGYWLLSKALFYAPNIWYVWLLIYGVSITISIYYFRQVTAKITLIIVLYGVISEWFWWSQSYPYRPEVHYFIGLMALTVWARQLLFNRIFIADRYFNYTSGKTGLDSHAGGILFFAFGLILLATIEYFVRHVAGMREVTTIYYAFTPISMLISAVTIAVIYMHYFNNQSKKHLLA